MTKRRHLTILSAAGLTSALAIGAIGGTVAADSPGMGATGSLEATEISFDADGMLLSGESEEGPEKHGGGGEGSESGQGEESGTQYAADQTYDETRAGVRLLLAYDAASNSFGGLVENTTDAVLDQVRVEVHLSNGMELGPTTPTDLAPGEVIKVVLPATNEPFNSFSAHPEVGGVEAGEGEHGPGGEENESAEYEGDDEHEEDDDDD